MFDIFFEDGDPVLYSDEDDWLGLRGQAVLGEFVESFVAPLGWWSRPDYERQWLEGANRLVSGLRQSAFVLQAGRLWWTAWLDDARVIIQQLLLVDPEMAEAGAARPGAVPYTAVGERRASDEHGHTISEWYVSVSDLREFLIRRDPTFEHRAPSS